MQDCHSCDPSSILGVGAYKSTPLGCRLDQINHPIALQSPVKLSYFIDAKRTFLPHLAYYFFHKEGKEGIASIPLLGHFFLPNFNLSDLIILCRTLFGDKYMLVNRIDAFQ